MNGGASWDGEWGDSALDGQLIGSSWWWGWLEQFIQVGLSDGHRGDIWSKILAGMVTIIVLEDVGVVVVVELPSFVLMLFCHVL